ncbi:unnamed protein product (macronuclear) [Paramecium tetraurelia]|uniref:Uncharacterized protein n=1 Tax=Paramecium tetraurelia TaxID=5888 RepID=A0DEL0_PARTE|nr:uncharacterized protein GSPATT00016303001 [Paramecium tetraurelia]CAK81477.1 unnamed protein product [Paramecium tetraurelia]|eukprot:XP_001448874.1 hypothetical protein (macronuclear) [Paramecium tetraurelia strain d4-2]
MSIDWKYDMSMGEVIDFLENNSLSKQQYKDVILSYHIQRLNQNKIIKSTTQTSGQKQQHLVTTLSQKIADAIKSHQRIFNDQFFHTEAMFQQILTQNVQQLNESMEKVSTQLLNLAQSKSINSTLSILEKTQQFEKYDSTISGISDVQSELNQLEKFLSEYKLRFKELTDKLRNHQNKFNDERKNNKTQQEQLLKNILDISNQQQ